MANTTQYIMDYAMRNGVFCIDDIVRSLPKDGTISLSSIKSTITRLVNTERLARVKRSVYALVPTTKNAFDVVLGERERELNGMLKEKFPFATFCIYNGGTLAALQHHLSFNNATYIETEREVMEAAFVFLRDLGYDVYLNPKADMVAAYIDLKAAPVVIKPLKSESPMVVRDGVVVPTLEKVLVDIRKDADFGYLQCGESDKMLANAESLYMINYSRLSRYGRRRGINMNNNDCS